MFTILGSKFNVLITCNDCEANASFNSNKPISEISSPASLSALGTASTGPTPIISGGTPATANDLNLSCGVNPSASAFSRSISRTDPAPSLIRSEEHTSELQSRGHLVCRLLLEKKKKK